MAALLLAAGSPGRRFVAPSAHIPMCVHMTSETAESQKQAAEALALCSGRPLAEVDAIIRQDRHMSAEEAVGFGIADQVLRVDAFGKGGAVLQPKVPTMTKAPKGHAAAMPS